MISKTIFRFCETPELIENYELAIADEDNCWDCHHKLEAFYTHKELIELGRYWDVAPRDLVFLKRKEHYSWPHKGRLNLNNAEARRKNSESNKGKKRSDACKQKHRENAKGNTNVRGKHWKLVEGKRCYY